MDLEIRPRPHHAGEIWKPGVSFWKWIKRFSSTLRRKKLKPNNQWSLWICFWRKLRKPHDYWLLWFHRFRIPTRSKYSCSAHTIAHCRHFQSPPVWRAFSKSPVSRRIIGDGRPNQRKKSPTCVALEMCRFRTQFWREIVLSGAFIGRNRGEWLTTGFKFLVRRRNTWSNVFFLYTWLFLLSRKDIKWKLTGYSGKYLVPFMVSTVKDNPSMYKKKSVFQVTPCAWNWLRSTKAQGFLSSLITLVYEVLLFNCRWMQEWRLFFPLESSYSFLP